MANDHTSVSDYYKKRVRNEAFSTPSENHIAYIKLSYVEEAGAIYPMAVAFAIGSRSARDSPATITHRLGARIAIPSTEARAVVEHHIRKTAKFCRHPASGMATFPELSHARAVELILAMLTAVDESTGRHTRLYSSTSPHIVRAFFGNINIFCARASPRDPVYHSITSIAWCVPSKRRLKNDTFVERTEAELLELLTFEF